MYPPADEQFVGVAVVKERVVAGLGGVTGIGGRGLIGYDEVVDKEGVGDERAAKDTAGFEVLKSVRVREVEE